MSAPPSASSPRLSLLSVDPELAEGIPADELALAARVLVADVHRAEPGAWDPGALCPGRGDALLVVRGVLTREVHLLGRRSAELFGPGDVLRPARSEHSLLPHAVSWTVTQAVVVAALGEHFAAAVRRWPSVGTVIGDRLLTQIDRLAVHVAIAQLGRVDQRLLALLWHLADRWGRVTPEGVTVPLKLTHEALGRLVGAQRPTVTLALAELAEEGSLVRAPSGGWLLDRDSRALLGPAERRGLASAAG